MKIRKWVDMGAEVEIEIGADDIRTALAEAFERATSRLDEPSRSDILLAFNSIGMFIRQITEEQIKDLLPGQREFIETFLRTQSERFK